MSNGSPSQRYTRLVEQDELIQDSSQLNALIPLENLYQDLNRRARYLELPWFRRVFGSKPEPDGFKGVYLHGDVGRGKSMLMDLFVESLPAELRVRRVHFHSFMLEIHDALHQDREGGIQRHIEGLVKNIGVLCFDEFHVNDIADAMILQRLFTALLNKGLIIVATSNYPPERLYEGGLQRERFLPFIDLIEKELHIQEIKGPIDYRAREMGTRNTYLTPLNTTTADHCTRLFREMSHQAPRKEKVLSFKGRKMYIQAAGDVAYCSFSQLCEQPAGARDYLALAQNFSTIFITDIPKMGYDRRNEAKRFMTLIDVLYDNTKRVVLTAESPPEKLYGGEDHAFEFPRTISRIQEMTSRDYLARWEKND